MCRGFPKGIFEYKTIRNRKLENVLSGCFFVPNPKARSLKRAKAVKKAFEIKLSPEVRNWSLVNCHWVMEARILGT
jgi:hypothetical protein